MKEEGNDKDMAWKIFIPRDGSRLCVNRRFRGLPQAELRQLHPAGVWKNVKYSVKHDAATKEGFERELVKEIDAAK